MQTAWAVALVAALVASEEVGGRVESATAEGKAEAVWEMVVLAAWVAGMVERCMQGRYTCRQERRLR